MRTVSAVVAVSVALLGFSTPAAAEKFEGKSQQGERVALRTDANDRVERFSIVWRAGDCSRPGWRLSRATAHVPPFDSSEAGSFADRGQYRVRLSDMRIRFFAAARGHKRGERRWSGTFRLKAFVKFDDGGKMTCTLRRIHWSARA